MTKVVAKAFMPVPAGIKPDPDMILKWSGSFQNSAVLMHRRIKDSVPDWKAFQEKIADISNQEWRNMVNLMFVSKGERNAQDIINMQKEKLKESYQAYREKLDYWFETVDGVAAKRFKEMVEKSAEHWARGMTKVLRFTGTKRQRGVSPWAGYFLTDDKRAIGMMPPGAQVTGGGTVNVARAGQRTSLKAGLIQKLTQAGRLIAASKYEPDTVIRQNKLINDFIRGLQDSAYADFQHEALADKSYCIYMVEGNDLRLEIQVVTP